MLIKNYASILNSQIHYLTITHLNTLNGYLTDSPSLVN